jgi:NADH dehydrogenase
MDTSPNRYAHGPTKPSSLDASPPPAGDERNGATCPLGSSPSIARPHERGVGSVGPRLVRFEGSVVHDILIAGGGFAAVWAAAAAARHRLEAGLSPAQLTIALAAPDDDMVIRPRLYEEAPAGMRVPLRRVLEPIGVEHVRARIDDVEQSSSRALGGLNGGGAAWLPYQRLVVATGSRLVRPRDILGSERFHDVDTLRSAVALEEHLQSLPRRAPAKGRLTAVVVGAGFVGLEVASELSGRLRSLADRHQLSGEVEVVLVERSDVIGPELGPGPRPVLAQAIRELGIDMRLGATVESYVGSVLRLSDGTRVEAETVIWTAGMRANPLTARVEAPRDHLGRLEVDARMRVRGQAAIFAAGDTASVEVTPGRRAPQSCQYAHQTGKCAGHNVVADLLGRPFVALTPDPYVTVLDLGAAGAVYTEGYGRQVTATGGVAKDIKRMLNRELIYPPVDDPEAILRAADYLSESRPATPQDYRHAEP